MKSRQFDDPKCRERGVSQRDKKLKREELKDSYTLDGVGEEGET